MKTPFSIKLIYWIVNSLFWIFIIGMTVIIVESILMHIKPHSYLFSKIGIELPLDLLTQSAIELNGASLPVKITKISGTINVWDLGLTSKIIYYVSTFFVGGIMIYALSLLKKMIANVKINKVFTLSNVNYLKRASYLFFIVWFIIEVVLRYIKQLIYTPSLSSFHVSTDYLFSMYLIIAAIILAVAYIFEQGVKLQEYKNLTI